jgi:probable HAF family extracellular repeat protein
VQGSTAQQTPQHHTYQLIDLGTLGGPKSYQSENGPEDQIINDAGVVGFSADTAVPDPNAPNNCFRADCFVSHATRWKNGVLTDLGALPGNGNSSGTAGINALGWIIAESQNGQIDPFSGAPEIRSVLLRNGEVIDLGTFGGNWSIPLTLNNAGVVVGFASNTIPYPSAFFPPSATQTRAYKWQNGVLTDLGTLGGPEANAVSINQSGQIAGISFTSFIPNPTTGIPPLHAVLWDRGNMIDLGTLGGTYSGLGSCAFTAFGANPCIGPPWVEEGTLLVNNPGQVMGTSNLAGDQVFHPFLWQLGQMQDLGTLGGDNGTGLWLTDQGEVVGQADVPKSPTGCAGAT